MPITLPPISRRRFLSSSVAVGAGLALGSRWSWGDDAGAARDPNRVVIFSDIHIDKDAGVSEKGVNMTDHLKQGIGEALALDKSAQRPGMLLVNGDCVHKLGEAADYEHLVKLLAPVREAGWPVHLSMGNHDNRDRFWAAVPAEEGGGKEHPMPDRQVTVVETPRIDWVMLDSLDQTNSTPGVVGDAQIKWLTGVLDDPKRKGKAVIVMVHHQPEVPEMLPMSTLGNGQIAGITDTAALMAVVRPRTNVKALVNGHTHCWGHARTADGLHLLNLPALAYVFKKGQPSAWTDWVIADGGAKVTLNTLSKLDDRNGQVVDLAWR